MNKQVTVTFEFDVETQTVSKLACFVDGVESKKKTTTKATKVKEIVLEDNPIVTLEPTKLVFNNRLMSDMELKPEDRIIIKYEKFVGSKKLVPVIGTDVSFDQEGAGNKVTKTNSVVYRGKANTVLAEHGSEFTIEPYKEGIWKLISLTKSEEVTYEEVVEQAENIDATIIVDDENEDTEVTELKFEL